MLKVLLVDDEKNIVDMLKTIVDWQGYGYEICGEAYDGQEAIELAGRLKPDLVIADINMPVVDGLKLSEYVSQHYRDMKVILLTGLTSFHHARTAVNIGVSHFLLKPVDKEEVESSIAKVKALIEQKRNDVKFIETMKSKADLTNQLLKEKFITDLITGKHDLSIHEIDRQLAEFGLKLHGNSYRVLTVEIDRMSEVFQNDEGKRSAVRTLVNLSHEIFAEMDGYVSFVSDDNRVVIAVAVGSGLNQNVLLAAEKIKSFIHDAFAYSLTIGIGSSCDSCELIYKSYLESLSALRYKLILGTNRIIDYQSIEFSEKRNYFCSEKKRNEILLNLRAGNVQNILKLLDSIFLEFRMGRTIENVQIVCLELFLIGNVYLNELDIKYADFWSPHTDPMEEIKQKETLGDIQEWILAFYKKSVEYVFKAKAAGNKAAVQRTIRYIESNMSNPEMNMSMIAKEMRISEDYLSSLFKKEFGVPLIKFFNAFRLDKAKELMGCSELPSLKEVALQVGFVDQNYFSKCFKKQFGVPPSEYLRGK